MAIKQLDWVAASAFAVAAVTAVVGTSAAQAGSLPIPGGPSEVVFEVFGSGSASTIATDPTSERRHDVALPWKMARSVEASVSLLQVVAVGRNSGCRIKLNGVVVAEQSPADSVRCSFAR